jgi:peroxiredoxin (alkyl hydroperoxide reductase subunit C)
MIKQGDTIPAATMAVTTAEGFTDMTTEQLFKGQKVVMFAVPGAFTPACSSKHLPGFVAHAGDLKAKGVDRIICMAVNDPFVMGAWAKAQGIDPAIITMAADGSGLFTKALGLEMDLTARGLGVRSQRFALIAKDGVVTHLAVEEGGALDISRAEIILTAL